MSKQSRNPRRPPPSGPTNLRGLAIEELIVGSWCASEDGSGPPTAVGVTFVVKGFAGPGSKVKMTCRLKSKSAVDTLIQSLLRHQKDVWPES